MGLALARVRSSAWLPSSICWSRADGSGRTGLAVSHHRPEQEGGLKPRPRDSHCHSLGDPAVLQHRRSAAEMLLASAGACAGICAGIQPGSRHPGQQQMSAPDRCPVRVSRALWPRLGEQGRDEGLLLEGTREQGGPKDARRGFMPGFHPWVPQPPPCPAQGFCPADPAPLPPQFSLSLNLFFNKV